MSIEVGILDDKADKYGQCPGMLYKLVFVADLSFSQTTIIVVLSFSTLSTFTMGSFIVTRGVYTPIVIFYGATRVASRPVEAYATSPR